jgi:hypothetical protein
MTDDEIRKQMAVAIVTSLRKLVATLRKHEHIRRTWQRDPVRCLEMAVNTIEDRHVNAVMDILDAAMQRSLS